MVLAPGRFSTRKKYIYQGQRKTSKGTPRAYYALTLLCRQTVPQQLTVRNKCPLLTFPATCCAAAPPKAPEYIPKGKLSPLLAVIRLMLHWGGGGCEIGPGNVRRDEFHDEA